jgi:predicted phosphodiesterase
MLGAISNSIGRAEAVAAAIQMLRQGGANYILHLGDIGGRHVLDALGGPLGVPCGFVWGDRDSDRMGLMRYGHSVGVECLGAITDFECEGKRVIAIHGEDRKLLRRLLDEQQHDLIFVGHELSIEDYTVGKVRVLNPGPLHGASSGNGSAMLIDCASGKLKLLPL